MTGKPVFEDIIAAMSAASGGNSSARVAVPADPPLDDLATRFAIALNLLLDDLALRSAERERTLEALRQSEQQLSSIYKTVADAIFQLAVEKDGRYRFVFVNRAFLFTTGLAYDQVVGKYVDEIVQQPSLATVLGKYAEAIREKRTVRWEETTEYPAGRLTGEVIVAPAFDDAGKCTHLIGAVHDITERKLGEERIRNLASIVESSDDAIFSKTLSGIITSWNKGAEKIFGYSEKEIVGKPVSILMPPERQNELSAILEKINSGEGVQHFETERLGKDGTCIEASVTISPIRDEHGKIIAASTITRDITQRKQAEEKIQKQLNRLAALREIDIAISGSFDVRIMQDTVLNQVLSQLHVDAAAILLMNTDSEMLEYAAGRGFQTHGIEQSRLRLGEGHAGLAALERKVVRIEDIDQIGSQFVRAPLIKGENFVSYYGVPLIAKGKVNGLLEIFHRSQLNPDDDWLDFLNALAQQAAIALDSAEMFENLQQSNAELVVAYDSTIEGWSHALDLRDKETEGHTLRVTDMTLRLARAMGIDDERLIHIRRGALLHDIGKIGVPDTILLKPGPLTDEEWVLMRKHPAIADQLLAPIGYLKPALDIPYCHHEKWDGTGYPRGLKEEQIPLAARIFAVVDVWDALRSDRPYRKAWSQEKINEHIKSLSGTHFEPSIVNAFFKIKQERG